MQVHQPIFTQTGVCGATALAAGTAILKDPVTGLVTQCTSGICDGILTADAQIGLPCNFYIDGSFALAANNASYPIASAEQPLKVGAGGFLIPVTANNDVVQAVAKATAAVQGSLVEVRMVTYQYGA
jgi:hypothetical protein